MLPSEKLAIAAHMHVLLRRKTGRVTDTEWMASNLAYATEIVRFARASAAEDGHADLAELADKLAMAMLPANSAGHYPASSTIPPVTLQSETSALGVAQAGLARYVRGIR